MDDESIAVELVVLIAGQVRAEGVEGELGDPHFVVEESFAKVGNDEVDFMAHGEELIEEPGCVGGTRCA